MSFITIKVTPDKQKTFQVDPQLQEYIIQLEMAVKEGDKGIERMNKIDPERFKLTKSYKEKMKEKVVNAKKRIEK